MGYIYDFDNTYTKQDKVKELESYLANEREIFNFGEGDMVMTLSEHTYYEMEIGATNGYYYWLYDYPNGYYVEKKKDLIDDSVFIYDVFKHKHIRNKYYNNHIRQKQRNYQLHELKQCRYFNPYGKCIDDNGKSYLKRYYRGKRSKYLKKQSSRIIRGNMDYYPKGNKVKRQFDFWWELD